MTKLRDYFLYNVRHLRSQEVLLNIDVMRKFNQSIPLLDVCTIKKKNYKQVYHKVYDKNQYMLIDSCQYSEYVAKMLESFHWPPVFAVI